MLTLPKEISCIKIDFAHELLEINGIRFSDPVVVGIPQYRKDGAYQQRLLFNSERADPMKKLPRIEVTFEPGSLNEVDVTGDKAEVL